MWSERAKVISSVTAAVAGTAVAAGAAASWVLADHVVNKVTEPVAKRPSARWGFTPFETGVSWEDVAIQAEDGSRMAGWLLVRSAAAPAILACGGHRGKRSDLLGVSSALWRAGYNVLLFDYRGYGEDPGRVTLGHRELADARAALRHLRNRFDGAPLGVVGFSMGAAIAVMLAAREPDVQCVLADSPFTTQREVIRHGIRRTLRLSERASLPVVGDALMDLVNVRLRKRFGFSMEEVRPLGEVAHIAPRPLLLIHGEEDRVIPVEHSRRLASTAQDAGAQVDTWFVPHAGHCDAYFIDRAAYCERAASFFDRHLVRASVLSLSGKDRLLAAGAGER